MVERLRLWKPYRIVRDSVFGDFIMFSFIGGIVTLFDIGVFWLLVFSVSFFQYYYLITNIVSFIFSVLLSFTLNRKFTFRSSGKAYYEIPKFFIVALLGLGVSELVLYVIHGTLEYHVIIAKLCAVACTVLVNFFGNKFWTFRHKLTSLSAHDE